MFCNNFYYLGETSTTPLSPGSPAEDSSGETHPNKSRLQRIKPQSRKTFRLRKSRKNRIEVNLNQHSILFTTIFFPNRYHIQN